MSGGIRCLLVCTTAWQSHLFGWGQMCRLTKAGLHAEDALARYSAADDEAAAAVLAALCSQEGGNARELAAVAACEAPLSPLQHLHDLQVVFQGLVSRVQICHIHDIRASTAFVFHFLLDWHLCLGAICCSRDTMHEHG